MRIRAWLAAVVAFDLARGAVLATPPAPADPPRAEAFADFDVVIAGGTTAAFACAVASAESGARTALIEPTDWVGGQITASAVPAVDEAWHKVTDPATKRSLQRLGHRSPAGANMTANFRKDARRHRQPRWRLGEQLLLPAQARLLRTATSCPSKATPSTSKLVVYREARSSSRSDVDPATGQIQSDHRDSRGPTRGRGLPPGWIRPPAVGRP